MAICTIKGHVSRAIDFFNKGNSMFVGIGKSKPWDASSVKDYDPKIDYEQYPPAPSNTDELLEIIGYKQIEFRALVVQDNVNGTLEYRGTKWRIVPESDAIKEGARWVFISTELTYNELPTTVPYRQVGVFTGLRRASGVSTAKYALLPNEVADNGILENQSIEILM